MAKPYKILGLDIGIGSCGWAILDTANENIVNMGVHLWEVPQHPKTHESYAAARRAARSSRRNTKRNVDRAKHCLRILAKHGLIPSDADKKWMQTIKGDPQPLESRVTALDEPINDRHLAQALYNISLRRGYIPHGEGADEADSEGRKVLGAIDANLKEMQEKGWRTVGEMMLKDGRAKGGDFGLSRNKGGDYSHCVKMSQLVDEVNAILDAQIAFGNPKASEILRRDFLECMTWEKDTKDHDKKIYESVGWCTYFEGERRGAKACLSFEKCQAYERINNVRIVGPNGEESHLPAEAKRWAIETLFSPVAIKGNKDCKVTYKALRKKLDLSASCAFKGIDFDKEKTQEIATPKIWRKERNSLPQELVAEMAKDRGLADAIGSALAYSSREDNLIEQLQKLDLPEGHIEALCSLPFSSKAFSGYGNRSILALQMLCDAFEDFETVSSLQEAEEASGLYRKRTEERTKGRKLPPFIQYDPTCNNPVVLRVMGRVRKLVNAIIAEYGMPDEIHIELARELKHSKKEKDRIAKANNDRARYREIRKNELALELNCSPDEISSSLLRKYELYVEQKGIDVYTGAKISEEKLLTDSAYCQIDHILPYSRTCDDSQSNKVLVLNSSNQDKRERSPYEWLSATGDWAEFEARIISLGQQGYPYKKRQKLLERDLIGKETSFIERNLNDTRYATRSALNYIDAYLEFPDNGKVKHVYAVAGGATSSLRSSWGFSNKDREADDCHHAVDAAIIAACSASSVMRIAKASEKKYFTPKEDREKLFRDTEPWNGFAEQVNSRYGAIIPTRKPEHGGTARLFEDTTYRYLGLNEKGAKGILMAAGKESPAGNFVINKDGSASKPDGMAFLRLWWDDETKKYLKEPVYYADLAAISNDSYIPRYFCSSKPRMDWPIIPDSALQTAPITLHFGDCVRIGDELLRFKGMNTSSGMIKLGNLRKFSEPQNSAQGISKAKDPSFVRVVNEDILGLCFLEE